MSFPVITTKATNMELSSGLSALIDQKLVPLGRLIGSHETDLSCKVEVERLAPHQSGKIYRMETNLYVSGRVYRAEATEEQIEKAIDEVRDELKRELERAHGKRQSLLKRGGQAIKAMIRDAA